MIIDVGSAVTSVWIAISAGAVLMFLWSIAKTVEWEESVTNLKIEARRLLELRERKLREIRGEEELGSVTIIDEAVEGGGDTPSKDERRKAA